MTRTTGSHGPTTAAAIRKAGLRLIYEQGFEAMSLRHLAADVGVQPASLYNHIKTKQALLFGLIHEHMLALLAQTDQALAESGPDVMQRLRGFIAHHLLYHMEKKREVFVANFELRSLNPGNYRIIVMLRRSYEQRLVSLLEEGIAAGALAVPDTRIAAYAILAMLTGACTWYQPSGRLSKATVVALHTDLVLRGCLAPDAKIAGPSG
ncbi:MAG: TetR/AcrR family transcriptional regulator [Acetobacteraceae bacterium]